MWKTLIIVLLVVTIGVCQDFYARVRVENMPNIVGMSIYLKYDNTAVIDRDTEAPGTQVEIEERGFFPSGIAIAGIQKNYSGVEEPGVLVIGYAGLPLSAVAGNGNCFDILFTKQANEVPAFSFLVGSVVVPVLGTLEPSWGTGGTGEPAVVIETEVVGVRDVELPKSAEIYQNFPNPFNAVTKIMFNLTRPSRVKIVVTDTRGGVVYTESGYYGTGVSFIVFNGTDLASGVYYYTVTCSEFEKTRKMVLMR